MVLHFEAQTNRNQYNLPFGGKIVMLLLGYGDISKNIHDVILCFRGDRHHLEHINECHPMYLPLHYILVFFLQRIWLVQ